VVSICVVRRAGCLDEEPPRAFPLELANRLVRMFSFVGDTVLDPFSVTGTTLLAALSAQRDATGIEIDPAYLGAARNRLAAGPGVFSLFAEPLRIST